MFPRLSLFVDDGEASLSEVLKALIVSPHIVEGGIPTLFSGS